MSTALSPIQQVQHNGSIAVRHELDVVDVIAQVKKIQLVMSEVMKEGEHYGVIPGTNKPTLLKPGAEKLLLTFRFDPQYESTETYEGKHLTVKSRCMLYHITTGMRMGSGEGSCSTKESKYAYRKGQRLCPRCNMETILKSKFPPRSNPKAEPGWYCFAKRGGCGFEFAADDPAITEQSTERMPNEDLPDQYNTVLKMANKRALVAAVLNVTAASDIFTQDMEDAQPAPVTAGVRVGRDAGASESTGGGAPTELIPESEALFPDPKADALRTVIRKLFSKIAPGARGDAMKSCLGQGKTLEQATLAELTELEKLCQGLQPK